MVSEFVKKERISANFKYFHGVCIRICVVIMSTVNTQVITISDLVKEIFVRSYTTNSLKSKQCKQA